MTGKAEAAGTARLVAPGVPSPLAQLAQRVRSGETGAIARALRMTDDRLDGYVDLLKVLWPHTGRARVVGVTGNPGAGKSTLCDRLIAAYRARGDRVAVVAVDPTSPYSGGAILGDRIRMSRHSTDEGVFIRSLATRGHLGGLSGSARDVVRVLDAAGYSVVLVETVGVGQDELEITCTAQSTVVVMAPGLGDEIQAIKAGILEAADVFAVNKADREGADVTVRDLELMIALGDESIRALSRRRGHASHGETEATLLHDEAPAARDVSRWRPPIVKCVATRAEGVEALVDALDRHHAWLESTDAGHTRRRARLAEELRSALREALIEAALRDFGGGVDVAVCEIEAQAVDPYTATENLVQAFRSR